MNSQNSSHRIGRKNKQEFYKSQWWGEVKLEVIHYIKYCVKLEENKKEKCLLNLKKTVLQKSSLYRSQIAVVINGQAVSKGRMLLKEIQKWLEVQRECS